MKHYLITIVAAITFLLAGCNSSSQQEQKTQEKKLYRIGVIQLMTNPGIDAIREGFLDEMKKMGYEEGESIKYYQENSQGDNSVAQSIAKKFEVTKLTLFSRLQPQLRYLQVYYRHKASCFHYK